MAKVHNIQKVDNEYQKYKAALAMKYGDEVPVKLEQMAQDQPSHTYKHSREELLEIIHSSKEYLAFLVKAT